MRGNINKKYLKRRKNWFQRNLYVFIIITIIVAIIAVGAVLVYLNV